MEQSATLAAMSRHAGILPILVLCACSLGTDLTGSYSPDDTGDDGDTTPAEDPTADLPPDPADTPDADAVEPTDAPDAIVTDADPDAIDEPDAPPPCDPDAIDRCPPGPANTQPTACDEAGCTYGCAPGFADRDDDADCECQITEEICDGRDNDCNGVVDDDLDTVACDLQEGVCAGSVAGCVDEVAECDDAVYASFAEDHGLVFDPRARELRCDGQDNDCDGVVDPLCCGDTPWVGIAPISPASMQTHPAVARKGEAAAVAWIEATFQGADALGPIGTVRYAYLDQFAMVTGVWRLSSDEQSSQVDIARSERADRFVIARVSHPTDPQRPLEVRQWEVHREPQTDAVVDVAPLGSFIDGIDQTYVDSDTILITWAVRRRAPASGVVYVRAVDPAGPDFGDRQQVSADGVIASQPRIATVDEHSLLVYRFDAQGLNNRRTRGLRWRALDDESLGEGGEFVFNPTADEMTRDWDVFPYGDDVAVAIPSPPDGAVTVLVIDLDDPRLVRVIPQPERTTSASVTGFGANPEGAVVWWSQDRHSLQLVSLRGDAAVAAQPLIDGPDVLGGPFGVSAASVGDWGVLAATSSQDLGLLRLQLTAVSPYGGRLCDN